MVDYSDGDVDVEMGEPAKPVVIKTEGEKRGRKKALMSVNKRQDSPDKFSVPQHHFHKRCFTGWTIIHGLDRVLISHSISVFKWALMCAQMFSQEGVFSEMSISKKEIDRKLNDVFQIK